MNLLNKTERDSDLENELLWLTGGREREFGTRAHRCSQKGSPTRTYYTAYGALLNVMWQRRWEDSLGKMYTCVCTAESLHCSPETVTTLLIGYAAAKSPQSYPTLCDPIDSSPPGSAVPGILQARTLEWVAISFSKGSSQARD